MREIPPPRATSDYLPNEAAAKRSLLAQFADTVASYGFQPIETPSYERVELFLAGSGPELKASMLTFHADHEEFALRPELTAPVCRLLASGELDEYPKPLRLFYSGSCFRYVRPGSSRDREFTQAGVELLGESGPAADAEVIAAGVRYLRRIGVSDFTLRLGALSIFRTLLPDTLQAEDRVAVLGRLDQLSSIRERCAAFAAHPDRGLFEDLRLDRKELAGLQEQTGYEGDYAVSAHADVEAAEMAERLPLEAEVTFRRICEVEDLAPAKRIETLLRLSRLRGPLDHVIAEARSAVQNTPAAGALDALVAVCEQLDAYGITDYRLDLGVARGLTFYTGVVFEFTSPEGIKYGGGGRYDGLAELFGGPAIPAVGCAFRFDTLLDAFRDSADWLAPKAFQLYLRSTDAAMLRRALSVAEELRSRGFRVGLGSAADPSAEVAADLTQTGKARLGDAELDLQADALAGAIG